MRSRLKNTTYFVAITQTSYLALFKRPLINLKTLFMACLFAVSATSFADSYSIDKTIVQSNQGQHFFSLELNNVIDQETANKLQVTDMEGNVIEGTIQLLANGTALKTSIIQFFPTKQECFKKIITLTLGDVSTRIVPGTSGISVLTSDIVAKSGFGYSASEAMGISNGYGSGSGIRILDVIPRPGTQGASPYTPLMVFFSDIIDTDTVHAENMTLKEASGDIVSGQIGFSTSTAGNTIVTFTPNNPLKVSTDYIFEVNANLRNSEIWKQFQEIGNALEPEEKVLEKRKEVVQKFKDLLFITLSFGYLFLTVK